jgi:YD repeat-containing protein
VLTVTQPMADNGVRPQVRLSYTQVAGAGGPSGYILTGTSACQTGSSCTGTPDEAKASAGYNSNLLPTTASRGDGTGALTATTAMTYDARGNLLTLDGPLAGTADTTAYKYDSADQRVGTISPDPDGAGALKNRAIRLTYRSDGQVSKQELGNTLGQSDSDFAAMTIAQTVDIGFDSNNRPVTAKLSAGGTDYALTQTSYDALGRIDCSAVRMNPAIYGSLPSSACALGTQGSFGPDRIGQLVYDAAGQVIQNKVAVGTSDAATERTLTYTTNGMLATLKDAENNLTTYEYDGFDRLSKTRFGKAAVNGRVNLSGLFSANPILQRITNSGQSVINTTQPGHILHSDQGGGQVVRTVLIGDNGAAYSSTIGSGTNSSRFLAGLNVIGGLLIFDDLDDAMADFVNKSGICN